MRLLWCFLFLVHPLLGREAVLAPKAAHSLIADMVATENELIAVGEWGHAFHWKDGLEQEPFPSQTFLTGVAPAGDGGFWAVGHDALIAYRAENGAWEVLQTDPSLETPLFAVNFISPSHGIAVGAYGLVYHTYNAGRSWNRLFLTEEDPHFYAVKNDTSHWYLAGEFGTVLKVSQEGDVVQNYDTDIDFTLFGIEVLGADNWIAYGLLGRAIKYRGENTQPLDVPAKDSLYGSLRLPEGVLFFGAKGRILLYQEGQWQDLSLTERVDLLAAARRGSKILFGTVQGLREVSR